MARLNLNHLRYFRAVAREGNLTRAAERLNLSQSALSVQVRALEDRLGHALFDRRGRGLELTEAGRLALDHAETVHAAGEALLSALEGGGERPLRVGALDTLSRNFLARALRPARGAARLVLRSLPRGALIDELGALGLDIAITDRPAPAGGAFRSHRLAEARAVLAGPPDWMGADAPVLLAERPLVVPARGNGVRAGLDRWLDAAGVAPRIAAECDDMATLRLLARDGFGIAVAAPVVVEAELASGALVAVPAPGELVETFWAITAERRVPHPVLPALLAGAAEIGDHARDPAQEAT